MGLHEDTNTWEYLTEEQYKALQPIVGSALPSMVISKVKKKRMDNLNKLSTELLRLVTLTPTTGLIVIALHQLSPHLSSTSSLLYALN